MFSKILIANRGAIACRIIRTLKAMGIHSVAIYAESDKDSSHIKYADQAFCLGEGPARTTYLDQEKIIQLAKENNVDAIHPGYGFLSENINFVRSCAENNITFIGPSIANMDAFSLKHKARSLASQHQVPLVPGSPLLNDIDQALSEAKHIGYPVILKSSAGGGGIGMEICHNHADIHGAFNSVVRLSQNNFSDDRVFLEKYIEHARHVEVQIFGNGKGDVVDIGDRDCSLQRRNQKVVEEAPAPNLPSSVRTRLHETARRLMSAIHYQSAGTVEFIYDTNTQDFYFLEVNTRLQVEHGVTEAIYNVDIVQWMVEQAHTPIHDLDQRRKKLRPHGHAIQARVYAENPIKNFQPSAGLLSHVQWGDVQQGTRRIETWISSGTEVSPFFDPLLAKIIVSAESREHAIASLAECLGQSEVYGIETNLAYLASLMRDSVFIHAKMHTRYLNTFPVEAGIIEVLSPGTMTTVQDLPGRTGYWEVGVPPSGPFDSLSFRLGNQLLHNSSDAAGLEVTVQGPSLTFFCDTQVVVAGAEIEVFLDDDIQATWKIITVKKGQALRIGKILGAGSRAYLLIKGGIQCPDYLGSKSTFTLGHFGGHVGRALRSGDCLKIPLAKTSIDTQGVAISARPPISHRWTLRVIYGPHGAPDFFTQRDIDAFFSAEWEVHYNSSRTGIRLIGPKPEWARESGGEAGMHPSNIHDNAYAFGSVDFTGDMPVILGPDGPSLGGFVCPATVITADLWKLGQMCAGDKLQFKPVSIADAMTFNEHVIHNDSERTGHTNSPTLISSESCVLKRFTVNQLDIGIRPAGDRFILVEFGEQKLDLRLRFQVYALREQLLPLLKTGIVDLTPGIRSLQVHFDPKQISHQQVLDTIEEKLRALSHQDDVRVKSRVVHLPLSWDDKACHDAIEKYSRSVRANAPWCPDNIEFIRRINGLHSVDDVKKIVFDARYVVMGLGDVYLGAPVATPLDPRHRLVTTKYNPARTWTAENSVGIGGAYLCIYGLEGPGGYQFIGRTLQMWNRYRKTQAFSQPWLLRFFDQIRFYEVSHDELNCIRQKFPNGDYPITIEQEEFSLKAYEAFLEKEAESIASFEHERGRAFDNELQRWRNTGQFHFESSQNMLDDGQTVPDNLHTIESQVAGSIWKLLVATGDHVNAGQTVAILESMKMEIEITAPQSGTICRVLRAPGDVVSAGQALFYWEY